MLSNLFLLIGFIQMTNQQPSVSTSLGTVLGFEIFTKNNDSSEIFLGIPYAKPPKGELRFKKPEDPAPFGTLNATKFGPICIPHTRKAVPEGKVADEDCLTLNIMRPKNRSSYLLPVLVHIHGGGFTYGSAQDLGYKGLAENYNPKGIIIVTIQYRLAVHGFLSAGIKDLNGNFGLFDQAKALEFIEKYIVAFGGDKNKVTVWGLSAGGASASSLSISPYTRDKMAGSIAMSGNSFFSLNTGPSVLKRSWELIKQLNCVGSEMATCLRNRSVDEIYDAVDAIGYITEFSLDAIKWTPTIDGDFFPAPILELIRQAPKNPVMIGQGSKEAVYFTLFDYANILMNCSIPVEEQKDFNREKLITRLMGLVPPEYFRRNTSEAWDLIIEKYAPFGQSTGFYLDKYAEFVTTVEGRSPTVNAAKAARDAEWPVYIYKFDHYNPNIFIDKNMTFKEAWGSPHTNEYSYMFDEFFMSPFNFTQDDENVKDQIVSAIASFAINGKPTVGNMTWPTAGNDLKYYVFKPQPEIQSNYFKEEHDFMEQLRALGFDMSFLAPTVEVDHPTF